MSKNKLRFVLVLIWISCLIVLLLADALILRHPTQNGLYAPHRLMLPSKEAAMTITENMSEEQIIAILGHPTAYDLETASEQKYWNLQFGYRFHLVDFGFNAYESYDTYITGPFEHWSWLILPGGLIVIAMLETIFYLIIVKKRSGSK